MLYSELPNDHQPAARLREIGPTALDVSELLAVALRINTTEAAQALAEEYRQAGSLARIPQHHIRQINGLGVRYTDSIAAIIELARREMVAQAGERPAVHSPQAAAELVLYEMSALDREQARVIMLDTRNRVIRVVTLYQGTLNSAQVRIAEVFRCAMLENAAAIIFVHNHPSGDPTPSPEDISLTRSLVQAGKLVDIDILDHLVIGGGRFVSLKERGLGFN